MPIRACPSAATILESSLARRLGGVMYSRAALAHALERSARKSLPEDPETLLGFAWAHLVSALASSIGAAEATEFLHALQRELEDAFETSPHHGPVRLGRMRVRETTPRDDVEDEPPISSVRAAEDGVRVVVIDEDHITRTAVARALAARGVELVIAFESLDEIDEKLLIEEAPHVLYCDLEASGAAGRLFELVSLFGELAIVARAKHSTGARVMLELMHAKRFEVIEYRPKTADAVATILARARTVAAETAADVAKLVGK